MKVNLNDSIASDFVKDLKQQCGKFIKNVGFTSQNNEVTVTINLKEKLTVEDIKLCQNRIDNLEKKLWKNNKDDIYSIVDQGLSSVGSKQITVTIEYVDQIYYLSKKDMKKVILKEKDKIVRQIESVKKEVEKETWQSRNSEYKVVITASNHNDEIRYDTDHHQCNLYLSYKIMYLSLKNKEIKLPQYEITDTSRQIYKKINIRSIDENIKVDGFDCIFHVKPSYYEYGINVSINLYVYSPKDHPKNYKIKMIDDAHLLKLIKAHDADTLDKKQLELFGKDVFNNCIVKELPIVYKKMGIGRPHLNKIIVNIQKKEIRIDYYCDIDWNKVEWFDEHSTNYDVDNMYDRYINKVYDYATKIANKYGCICKDVEDDASFSDYDLDSLYIIIK